MSSVSQRGLVRLAAGTSPAVGTNPAGRAAAVAVLCLGFACAAAAGGPDAEPAPEELAALVARLGDDDYIQRESAAAQLNAIGPAAVDALLAAAEVSDDLEVALRARWLVDTITLNTPRDTAEVAKLLERFNGKRIAERVQVMHRLLRVDDDAGIEPLARIVRLDRSSIGSRVAAALLAREWRPDDPYWKGMCPRITAGLGGSSRPAAEFLRSLVAFSQADAAARGAHLDAAGKALAALARGGADEARADADAAGGETSGGLADMTLQIFQRCRIQMLLAGGRRPEAVAEVARLVDACLDGSREKDPETVAAEVADLLVWSAERGVTEAVDAVSRARPELCDDQPLVGYAAAVCERARKAQPRAETLADTAFKNAHADFANRLQHAILLAKWGGTEWADREYRSVLDDAQTPGAQFALAAIMYSEFLHDQEREAEAAGSLRRLFEEHVDRKGGDNQAILQQIGRDPRSVRSRMHYFESCAAALRGDAAGRRRAIEESLRSYPKDVDALIALHSLPDSTAEQRTHAVARIHAAQSQIDGEIQAVPDDSNGYNEYAWLVANTLGDVQKAMRYSKLSLIKSFDNSSYLDTLAHCRAAAGDHAGAIRTQSLALRQEPHNRTIRRNLERFRKAAGGG
jgi:hypothetical protein